MPGDLNVKKSWHPALAKNRARVQAQEQKALAERQRIQERQAEIAKDHEIKELRAMRGLAPSSKLGWMYEPRPDPALHSVKGERDGLIEVNNPSKSCIDGESIEPKDPPKLSPPKESHQSARRKLMADPMADLLGPNKKAVSKKSRKQLH